MNRFLFAAAFAGLALMMGASFAIAQVQKGKTRPLETKMWMRAVNQPQCSNLAKMLKEGPADDKAWETVIQNAQMLNEAGHVLMADSRCPDARWADASKMLRDGSEVVLKAAAAKNVEEARTGLQSVLGACKTCHGAHKK